MATIEDFLDTLSEEDIDKFVWLYSDEDGYTLDEVYEDMEYEFKETCQWITQGATKIVIKLKDENSVVYKIPFQGLKLLEGDYYHYDDDYISIQSFDQADAYLPNMNISEWNYCEVEEFFYKEAVAEGVEEFFAKTSLYKNIDGLLVYTSSFCPKGFYSFSPNTSEMAKREANSNKLKQSYQRSSLSEKSVAIFIDQYGIEKVNKLFLFLEKWHISDLHCGNLRYDKNYMLKITDYSSYNE